MKSDCKWIQFSSTCDDNFVSSSRSTGSEGSNLRCNWKKNIVTFKKIKILLILDSTFLSRTSRRYYSIFSLGNLLPVPIFFSYIEILLWVPLWYCLSLSRTEAVITLLHLSKVLMQKQGPSSNTNSVFLGFFKVSLFIGNYWWMIDGPLLYFLKTYINLYSETILGNFGKGYRKNLWHSIFFILYSTT